MKRVAKNWCLRLHTYFANKFSEWVKIPHNTEKNE